MNRNTSLNDWLVWIKAQSVKEINLSLERVLKIGTKLHLLKPNCKVIIVAGTNGKGSTVAALETIYLGQGFKVGAFTTPYLLSYNEQVRLQGHSVDDFLLCQAFERIKVACADDTSLTLFEYGALAAFLIFKDAKLDIWLLEVGLGGRWDAVNVIDADIAVVTSIGIDHVEWLGDTRELIAVEKAGVFRKNKPAICGDFDPPVSLIETALQVGAPMFVQGKDFGYTPSDHSWTWWCSEMELASLPFSKLLLQNLSTALMVVHKLQTELPVHQQTIEKALLTVTLPGRIQVVPGEVEYIYDVAHNPAAVEILTEHLKNNPITGNTLAIFSMLMDKDIVSTINEVKPYIDQWFIAILQSERAATLEKLRESFKQVNITKVIECDSIKHAYENLKLLAQKGDRIIVFGSFRTVAEVLSAG